MVGDGYFLISGVPVPWWFGGEIFCGEVWGMPKRPATAAAMLCLRSFHCICGATFINDHDAIALHNFVAFVYRAHVGTFDEAEDNVRLLTAFKALHKRRVVTLQGAMRLAALAGITGKTETVT